MRLEDCFNSFCMLRSEKQNSEEIIKNTCFICGLERKVRQWPLLDPFNFRHLLPDPSDLIDIHDHIHLTLLTSLTWPIRPYCHTWPYPFDLTEIFNLTHLTSLTSMTLFNWPDWHQWPDLSDLIDIFDLNHLTLLTSVTWPFWPHWHLWPEGFDLTKIFWNIYFLGIW